MNNISTYWLEVNKKLFGAFFKSKKIREQKSYSNDFFEFTIKSVLGPSNMFYFSFLYFR